MSFKVFNKVKLKDITLKITDGTHSTVKDDENGKYFLLSCKNIKSGEIQVSEKDRKINKESFEKLRKRTNLDVNDTLITTVGTIGESAFIKKDPYNIEFQRSVAIIKPDITKIYPEYLYYCTKNRNFIKQSEALTRGSVQKCLFLGAIEEIEISMPNLEEQKRIVPILSSLDIKIETNNQINKKLEEMAQAIFKQWFVDFEFPNEDGESYKSSGGEMVESEMGMIPKGWKIKTLLDIADYLNGLAMQKFRPVEDEKGIPVLKIKELRQGSTDDNSDLCSPQIPKDYIIKDGDVIFSWSGSLLIDIWCGGKCGLNQHLFKVTSSKFEKWFYYLWTHHHLDKFVRIAKDKATTMGHIKREDLANSIVLVPNEEMLNKSNLVFKPIIEKIIESRIENRNLVVMRDTLLPKLMSGEIRV